MIGETSRLVIHEATDDAHVPLHTTYPPVRRSPAHRRGADSATGGDAAETAWGPPAVSAPPTPVVLSLAGHDPVGGAGIQADIETAMALGCHATTVIACLTVQDTTDAQEVAPTVPGLVARQARAVLADLPIGAIKVGLMGSAAVVAAVAGVLAEASGVPVVIDPVLASGGGHDLADARLIQAMLESILPLASLVTPNSDEARRLTGQEDLADCAAALLRTGCRAVLVTGGHETGPTVVNRLYRPAATTVAFETPRLAGRFRGTGCTLSTAIAAHLAHGRDLEDAIEQAMAFTSAAIRAARPLGRGRWLLGRSPPGR